MTDTTTNRQSAQPPASRRAAETLDQQRKRHQPDDVEIDDEGIGALVNNTGLDGDAPTS